jgi:hypothetical protein
MAIIKCKGYKLTLEKKRHQVFGRSTYRFEIENQTDRLSWLNRNFCTQKELKDYLKEEIIPYIETGEVPYEKKQAKDEMLEIEKKFKKTIVRTKFKTVILE